MVKPPKETNVFILGAGVAGMTAAHELAERGFKVKVFERALFPGGKAATQYPSVELSDDAARRRSPEMSKERDKEWQNGIRYRVPAEHGFRLFPSFYRHIIDTMGRIPFDASQVRGLGERVAPSKRVKKPKGPRRSYRTVADNLIPTRFAAMARFDKDPEPITRAGGSTLDGFLRMLGDLGSLMHSGDYTQTDVQRLQLKMMQYLTSCDERRDQAGKHGYGDKTWWEFLDGPRFSESFQNQIETFIRTMVAMEARNGNCRTVGNVAMQLAFDMVGDGSTVDRVLNGPSSDQWLLPWEDYLTGLHVEFKYGKSISGLEYDRTSRKITEIRFSGGDSQPVDVDDIVIAALPLEVMTRLLSKPWADPIVAADAGLAWIRNVDLTKYTSWMSGIQFYLDEDVPIIRGHVYYPESAWKLSSVSQAQFWGPEFRENYGAGKFSGILSVDVCDWDSRVGEFYAEGATASECRRASDVANEVWAQLRSSLTRDDRCMLPERYAAFHIDDSIVFPYEPSDPRSFKERKNDDGGKGAGPSSTYRALNTSPYFIHPAGSHLIRPRAETGISNLFLAADYVRTGTDLATMEGANEAARLAVNAILAQRSSSGRGCAIFKFEEPAEFDYVKSIDKDLFTRGEPHLFEVLGLLDRFNRSLSTGASQSVVSIAASSVKGSQIMASGLPDFIARVF